MKNNESITMHSDGYGKPHMAVNVKHYAVLPTVHGETELLRAQAWNEIVKQFWQYDAGQMARESGFNDAVPEGRSDGWCAPIYYTAKGKWVYPSVDDAADCTHFLKFQSRVNKFMATVSFRFQSELEKIIVAPKTFTFRFEYSVEAITWEDAAKQVAEDMDSGYSFRTAVADVLNEENQNVATVDFEKI
jgi:hypothetical protein